MPAKFPKGEGWTARDGTHAKSFAELALKRAESSQAPIWRVKPDSLLPVRLQLWLIRLNLFLQRLFT